MDQYGRVHEKLDVKILILFVLSRLPGTVDSETLLDFFQYDSGVDYFDFAECLSELVDTGHVEKTEEGYAITEKGTRNADAVESSLPFSVRAKTLRLLAPIEERLRRAAMITARHETGEGGCTVELAMADGKGEVLHLKLLCAGEEQAGLMEKRFRKNAEEYYQKIIALLSE